MIKNIKPKKSNSRERKAYHQGYYEGVTVKPLKEKIKIYETLRDKAQTVFQLKCLSKAQAIAFAKQEIKEWQKFIKELSNKKK